MWGLVIFFYYIFYYESKMSREWHMLTLEELILLTCSAQAERSDDHARSNCTGEFAPSATDDPPPKQRVHDDLETYIVLRWCPWFSRSFGPLSDGDMNALTVRLLNFPECSVSTSALKVLTAVAIVLTCPNVTRRPRSHNPAAAKKALFRD